MTHGHHHSTTIIQESGGNTVSGPRAASAINDISCCADLLAVAPGFMAVPLINKLYLFIYIYLSKMYLLFY